MLIENPSLARRPDGALHPSRVLVLPVDVAEDLVGERLDAEAEAVHAVLSEHLEPSRRRGRRVRLDADPGSLRQPEAGEVREQRVELLFGEEGRRASADVERVEAERLGHLREAPRLHPERVDVGSDHVFAGVGDRREQAVRADPRAEGDVDVERGARVAAVLRALREGPPPLEVSLAAQRAEDETERHVERLGRERQRAPHQVEAPSELARAHALARAGRATRGELNQRLARDVRRSPAAGAGRVRHALGEAAQLVAVQDLRDGFGRARSRRRSAG